MERIARMVLFVVDYHEEHFNVKELRGVQRRNAVMACTDATPHERELVYLLITCCWNDAIDWAKSVLA